MKESFYAKRMTVFLSLSFVIMGSIRAQSSHVDAGSVNEIREQITCTSFTVLHSSDLLTSTDGTWNTTDSQLIIESTRSPFTNVYHLRQGKNTITWTGHDGQRMKKITFVVKNESFSVDASFEQQVSDERVQLTADPLGKQQEGTWSIVQGKGEILSADAPFTLVEQVGAGEHIFRWTVKNVETGCIDFDDVVIFIPPSENSPTK